MKHYSIISGQRFDEILKDFTSIFGLPAIQNKLSIYAKHGNMELQVKFIGKKCSYKIKGGTRNETDSSEIEVSNQNLNSFLKYWFELGFKEALIGEIMTFLFSADTTFIRLSKDTFIGSLLEVESKKKVSKDIQSILTKNRIILLNRQQLKKHIASIKKKPEYIFDTFGALNKKIKLFGQLNGIDFESSFSPATLFEKLEDKSNDFSLYESLYRSVVGENLLSMESIQKTELFRPLTIVIPCFNSDQTILKTLQSIDSQNISQTKLKDVEVIVVDDCSRVPVSSFVDPEKFHFKLKTIRMGSNLGSSTARNVGFETSENTHSEVIFIDSDILLPANFLLEMSVRTQLIPNAIFLAFKKNVTCLSEVCNTDLIRKGLENNRLFDDVRVFRNKRPGKRDSIFRDFEQKTLHILADTDFFKDFGFGRKIFNFGLPSMVISHNLATSRSLINEVGGFSKSFIGWGMEDAYFGAKAISKGNFVIPVLSTGVYHVDHLPRAGSVSKKQKQYYYNSKLYEKLLKKEI